MVRIQLETGYLDVAEGTVFPLNFGVAEVRDLSAKSGTFSKTIKLPGTKNNHNLLNHYYDVNVVAGTFDVNAVTKCAVLQNELPIVEDAFIQLIAVNKKQVGQGYEEEVEYEVLVRDAQADFFTKIDQKELTDLDFTEMDHVYNSTNVVASWSNTATDGYVYPMGFSPDSIFSLTEFKPAIYVKKYWDKIHADAGYSYTWSTLQAAWFDHLIVPFNGDILNIDYSDYLVDESYVNTLTYTQTAGTNVTATSSALTTWTENQDNQNLFNNATGVYTNPFYIAGGQAINASVELAYDFNLVNGTGATRYLVDMDSSLFIRRYRYRVIMQVFKNGALHAQSPLPSQEQFTRNEGSLNNGTTTLGSFSGTYTIPITNLVPTDTIDFRIKVQVNPEGDVRWKATNSAAAADVQIDYEVDVTALNVKMIPTANVLQFGATISMNDWVPKQIKQKDFIKAICTMYNLYVEPDPNNANKLIYRHRDNFYDAGTERDWTYKLAKDQSQMLQFLPDLSAKKLVLSYKEDKDEPNTLFVESLNEVYGQAEYIFDNEYARGTDRKEVLFSPTPMGKTPFNAVVPLISGGAPKTNIRILLHNGTATCDQYSIYDYGTTGQVNITTYPQISHFDDHFNPTFDINWAACDFYYYDGVTVTNNNLYNSYWRRTIGQINTGKMLTAYFDLNEKDIAELRLNDKIRIDNSWWHINRIIDYNANTSDLTKVELLSVDEEIDFAPFIRKPAIPLTKPQGIKPAKQITKDFWDRNNINLSPESVTVTGIGNVIQEGLKGTFTGFYKSMVEDGDYSKMMESVRDVVVTQDDYNLKSGADGSSDYYIVILDGCTNVDLPLAGDNPGREFVGINRSASTVTITLSGNDTLDGFPGGVLLPGQGGHIFSDGSQWRIANVYTVGSGGGSGGIVNAYTAVTTTYTVTLTDYVVDATSGTFTITLPTAVGYTGLTYVLKNSGSGVITVDGNGSQTIDGNLSVSLIQYDSITVVSNGSNWIII